MRVLVAGAFFAWIVVPEAAVAQPLETTEEGTTEPVALQLELGIDESALVTAIAFTEGFGLEASLATSNDGGASAGIFAVFTQPIETLAWRANAGASWAGAAAEVAAWIAIEGPMRWIVRPMIELGTEMRTGEPMSAFGTIGAVIDVSDDVAIEAGAHLTSEQVEGRIGLIALVAP